MGQRASLPPGPAPRFADGVSLFVLDDVGVVFDEVAQEIYELNATATFIWCEIEQGVPPAEVSRHLAATFRFAPAQADAHVRDSLAAWQRHRFFDRCRPGARILDAAARDGGEAPAAEPAGEAVAARTTLHRRYRLLGRDLTVGFDSPALEAWVHPALTHLEAPARKCGNDTPEVTITRQGTGLVIADGGRTLHRCASARELATYLLYVLYRKAIAGSHYAVSFHAGALARGADVLVLPGAAGRGKTTVTAALVHAGLDYLTDDLLLLHGEDLRLEGLPFPLCVKEDGWTVLAPMFPQLAELAVHLRPDGKLVRYLAPPAPVTDGAAGRRARWVVFPSYEPRAATALRPLSRGAALRRLVEGCSFAPPLTRAQVETFIVWLRGLACYELPMASLAEAKRLLLALVREGGGARP